MTPTRVEIVPARRAGVTGYANVGRGTFLGNPYQVHDACTPAQAVELYRQLFHSCTGRQHDARKLLSRDWPDGVVRLGCPCNGHEKGQPCHATVIKEFLEAEISAGT
jgi:hypothetical protein